MVTIRQIERQFDEIGVAFISHTETGEIYWMFDRKLHICKPFWSRAHCKVNGDWIKAYPVSQLPVFKLAFIAGKAGRSEFELLSSDAAQALLKKETFSFSNIFETIPHT